MSDRIEGLTRWWELLLVVVRDHGHLNEQARKDRVEAAHAFIQMWGASATENAVEPEHLLGSDHAIGLLWRLRPGERVVGLLPRMIVTMEGAEQTRVRAYGCCRCGSVKELAGARLKRAVREFAEGDPQSRAAA